MRTTIAATAALCLALSSTAAQANTRAGDSEIAFETSAFADPGHGEDDEDHRHRKLPAWLPILLGLLILGGVAAAIGGDVSEGGNASPGTGG